MTTTRTWRDRLAVGGAVGLGANLLVYAVRQLLFHSLYTSHSGSLVVCAEAGFLFSIVVIVSLVVGKYQRFTMPLIIGSLVMLYLWFSAIAWWVMVK